MPGKNLPVLHAPAPGTGPQRNGATRLQLRVHFVVMAASIRDLKVWQEAVSLAAETIKAGRNHGRRETKVVIDQLMLTGLAVATAIADGYGRYTAPEQRQLYRAAKRDLLRLETQLAIARQADLLSAQTFADLGARIQSVGRLLGGYLVYLERQLTPEATAERSGAVRERRTR
jgi:four helix bundle protein